MAIRDYTAESLLVRPGSHPDDPGLIISIAPEQAGWELLSFEVRRLNADEQWRFSTADEELALVTLSGAYSITSNHGAWHNVGGRTNVFAGIAHTLYVPRGSQGVVTALSGGEFAVARAPSHQDHAPFLVPPENVKTFVRGGDSATRQINQLIRPGAPVERLVAVEVYTPAGSWSSYPPHKHDMHRTNEQGTIIEADLEEVYFYKFDPPEGLALQQVYTDPSSPLHRAGHPIDALIKVGNNEAVIVPEGYHPFVSPPGYRAYYLNFLAGSAQSLACSEDPRFAWVRKSYRSRDPRVPVYPLPREPEYEN